MDRYRAPRNALIISLRRGLYISIKMDCYGESHTALIIALHGGHYLAIIMDRYGGPGLPLQ
jgi:hypothetical protein